VHFFNEIIGEILGDKSLIVRDHWLSNSYYSFNNLISSVFNKALFLILNIVPLFAIAMSPVCSDTTITKQSASSPDFDNASP
jgi:hypothetical protein